MLQRWGAWAFSLAERAEMAFAFKYPSRVLKCGALVQPIHWSDDPSHDETWADAVSAMYGGRRSAGWLREFEMQPEAGGQPVWPMIDEDVHVQPRMAEQLQGPGWARYRIIDTGIRHPTCCAWVAISPRGDRVVYRQYYATGLTIAQNCEAILMATPRDEEIEGNVADPSIWSRNPVTGEGLNLVFEQNGLSLTKADNRSVGYDTVTTALVATLARWSIFHDKVHPSFGLSAEPAILEALASKPALMFLPEVTRGSPNIFAQCRNLRWKEVQGDPYQHAEPQKPVDVNDEGADVVRYAMQTAGVEYVKHEKPKDIVDLIKWRHKQRQMAGEA